MRPPVLADNARALGFALSSERWTLLDDDDDTSSTSVISPLR